jgi:hypothetical protein
VNVEHEMFCYTSNHWSHRNCNYRTEKVSGNNTRKAFNRFSTKNSCTRNITHYKESATIRNLKPEWRGFTTGSRGKVPGNIFIMMMMIIIII